MKRIVTAIVLLALIGGGAYMFVFKKDKLKEVVDAGRGFGDAKTPQECVDRFQKALKDRDYATAAKFCNKEYGEQLTRGGDAAKKLGVSIDNLRSRLTSDKNITKEVDYMLFINDPLPSNLEMTVAGTTDSKAVAKIKIPIEFPKETTGTWKTDPLIVQTFYQDFLRDTVAIVKEGEGDKAVWKLNFVVTPQLRARVDHLNKRYADYETAYKKVSEEVKRDATTKADVANRLREELNKAVDAKE